MISRFAHMVFRIKMYVFISIFPGGWMDASIDFSAEISLVCRVENFLFCHPGWDLSTLTSSHLGLVEGPSPWLHLVKPPPSWREPIRSSFFSYVAIGSFGILLICVIDLWFDAGMYKVHLGPKKQTSTIDSGTYTMEVICRAGGCFGDVTRTYSEDLDRLVIWVGK